MPDSEQSFELADACVVGPSIVRLRFADGGEFDLDLAPDLEAI